MGGRLVELGARERGVPVDEHALPRHEHAIEDHEGVRLVEARGEGVVVHAGRGLGIGAAHDHAQSGGGRGHAEREGVALVAGAERHDGAHEDLVGDGGPRAERLGARDDDAVAPLLDHPGIEVRILLLVRRLRAVDVGRDDDVRGVEVVVTKVGVEPHHVVAEALTVPREEVGAQGEARHEPSHVVGRAAHHSEGRIRPEAMRTPAFTSSTHRLPTVTVRLQNAMIAPFIAGGA